MSGHSSLTSHPSALNTVTKVIDDEGDVDLCFFDFSKVCNVVNHRIIWTGSLHTWGLRATSWLGIQFLSQSDLLGAYKRTLSQSVNELFGSVWNRGKYVCTVKVTEIEPQKWPLLQCNDPKAL